MEPKRGGACVRAWPDLARKPYDLLSGERKAPDGIPLSRPFGGLKAADVYAKLLAAEPHATAERRRELQTEATRQARQSPLFFDLTISLPNPIPIFHASLGRERPPRLPGRRRCAGRVLVPPGPRSTR